MKIGDHLELTSVETVCSQFSIGQWSGDWERLGGAFNANYKLTTDEGAFVVKISPTPNRAKQFKEIYRLQWHLADRGIPVALPLTSNAGEPYLILEDKLLQVSRFIEADPFAVRREQVRASGAMLRKFHDNLSEANCDLRPGGSFFQAYEYCLYALQQLASWGKISSFGLAEVKECVDLVYGHWEMVKCQLPMTIVHGDWHFWNQLFDGDHVCCVLDLDGMERKPRILDVAYVMWIIHILLPKHADEFRAAFFEGYGELSPTERMILPWATAKIALYFLCHSAYSRNPVVKWNKQYANQMPFIRWLLADGDKIIKEAATAKLGKESMLADGR